MKKIAAIILNYNSYKDTEKCVNYLKKQNYDSLNIVVVDNGSKNNSEITSLNEMAQKQKIKLICTKQNRGFSAGNNIGLRYADSIDADWAMIINPDVELRDEQYIEKVVSYFDKWNEAVVVGTNIVLPGGNTQNPMYGKTLNDEIFWLKPKIRKIIGLKPNKIIDNSKTGYCDQLTGCCFFINMDFIRKIGFLDENVFLYCEERILASQVSNLGYKELYIADITANHEHYVEKKKDMNVAAKMRIMINSRIYWIKKYSDYSFFGKKAAVISKRAEWLLWRIIWWK